MLVGGPSLQVPWSHRTSSRAVGKYLKTGPQKGGQASDLSSGSFLRHVFHWSKYNPWSCNPTSCLNYINRPSRQLLGKQESPWAPFRQRAGPVVSLWKSEANRVGLSSLVTRVAIPSGSVLKNPPAMQKTRVQSLHQEDPLEKGVATSLQYSCLDNPMDRRAWQATVHRVAKCWMWLSRQHMAVAL